MVAKHIGTAAVAALLLAGASTLALAQSSSKPNQPSSADTQKSPAAQSGKEAPSASGAPTSGQNESDKTAQSAPAKSKADRNATDTNAPKSDKNAAQDASQPSGKSAQGAANQKATSGSAPAAGGANLNAQQKTVIKNTIINNKSAPRVSHVDFNVSVGVAVPTSVHFARVPDTIVEIHPAWRGYDYFVYNEEVIIIQPKTRKIVAIIVVS